MILSLLTGVLEANFIEPAHDKQGFERTTVLARLEARLVQMQKHYWFVVHVSNWLLSIALQDMWGYPTNSCAQLS